MSSINYTRLLSCICVIVMLTAQEAACSRPAQESDAQAESTPTLRVTSILGHPYLNYRRRGEFVGLIPDLMNELSRRIGFNYEIRPVRDGKYGTMMPNGTWNGMIGELTRREADIAAAPLLVSSIRSRFVEFTVPFMINHLAVLIKKRHATQFDIRSISDLARQSTVKYGVIQSGLINDLFRTSTRPSFETMWSTMIEDTDVGFVRTIDEGVERVLASTDERPWAFVSGSDALTYAARQRSDVQVFIDPWNHWFMSLAVPIDSPYFDRLNLAILEMLESGAVNTLLMRWWNLE